MNNDNEQQHLQQHQPRSKDDDDDQGWCVVHFKLTPITVKYPRRPPALKTTKEEIKRKFVSAYEQDIRDQNKRQQTIKLSIEHPLFEIGKPESISEKKIFFKKNYCC